MNFTNSPQTQNFDEGSMFVSTMVATDFPFANKAEMCDICSIFLSLHPTV